jgi:hypothetical protein
MEFMAFLGFWGLVSVAIIAWCLIQIYKGNHHHIEV